MSNVWENYTDVPFELPNGTTIRVNEWHTETKTGTAVIRSGHMRIGNCPRFQIVVLFNNERVMSDRPIFRKFDDALEAANEWIANRKNEPIKVHRRRLAALPSPETVPVEHVPTFRPYIKAQPRQQEVDFGRQRCTHSKLNAVESANLDTVVVQEYRKLDFARTSLRQIHSRVSIKSGLVITEAMLQQRLKKNNLSYKDDKRKAVERAKPIIKEALRQILIAYPDYGARKCHIQLNKTAHRGYRFKLVDEMYREVRKESNTRAPTHPAK